MAEHYYRGDPRLSLRFTGMRLDVEAVKKFKGAGRLAFRRKKAKISANNSLAYAVA